MCLLSCMTKLQQESLPTGVIGSWASKWPRRMRASSGWARSGGGGGVIRRRHQQRNLFEAVIGSVEQLVEGQVEPALKRLDEVLADDTLLDAVMQQLAKRRPHSRGRGRPSTPGEVALRMLVLKRLKRWSFEQTEYEVRQNLVYRHLTRVYFERVPDAKTLVRLSAAIGEEGIKAIHQRVVEIAREQRLIEGRAHGSIRPWSKAIFVILPTHVCYRMGCAC